MSIKVHIIDRRINKKSTAGAFQELKQQLCNQGAETADIKFWEEEKDTFRILIGEAQSGLIEKLHAYNHISNKGCREGVLIHTCRIDDNSSILVVSGTDDRGLVYSMNELADRIRCNGLSVLEENITLEEYPENKVRGVDRYIMNHLDEEWFSSKDFWKQYLDKLVHNRFNRLTLITGFDTAYMTPPYPFFVKVQGFEEVSVEGLSESKRLKNLEMLNYIANQCEEKGIDFSFGSWQQMPWTKNQDSVIKNMPDTLTEFTGYCSKGVKTLIEACPGMKAIQFRVNMESGLSSSTKEATNTNEDFWFRMIDAIASTGRPIKLDIRAKGATDKMINYALKAGLDVTVPTKYWCEHAALPYHITKLRKEELNTLNNMNSGRRYSYGDLLRRPHWYDMIYRLWNYGSINLFLWGDADYCRRFSKSMHMGEGIGFEINAPLSLKGGMENLASEKPWGIHIHPDMMNYQFEDDRYWAYYLVFGRYGYNSETDYSVILREYKYRFHEAAGSMLAAYESASKVMPLITTVHFPVHPSLHYWPELYSGAALFSENNYETYFGKLDYSHSLPSDEELFYSIAEFTEDSIAGSIKPKYSPLLYRDWLHELSLKIRENIEDLSKQNTSIKNISVQDISIKDMSLPDASKEIFSTVVDFTMLADIADFHAWKIGAAYFLELFFKTEDIANLKKSYEMMITACGFWEKVSENGNKYYNHDLQFNAGTGTKRSKNWQDRLEKEVQKDVKQLEKLLSEHQVEYSPIMESKIYTSLTASRTISFSDTVPTLWESGKALSVALKVENATPCEDLKQVYLNYRHNNHMEGEYLQVLMKREGDTYLATIPAEYITEEFDLIVYFSAVDRYDNTYIHPGVYHPQAAFPYYVIKISNRTDSGVSCLS